MLTTHPIEDGWEFIGGYRYTAPDGVLSTPVGRPMIHGVDVYIKIHPTPNTPLECALTLIPCKPYRYLYSDPIKLMDIKDINRFRPTLECLYNLDQVMNWIEHVIKSWFTNGWNGITLDTGHEILQ